MSTNPSPTTAGSRDLAANPAATEGPADAAARSGLNVIRRVPLNAETPDGSLVPPVTPTPHVYVRTNFGIPQLDPRTHRVAVGGAVASPFDFAIADLATLEQSTVVVTMECAGNDRTKIVPAVPGEPWTGGAVSTVRWTGVPLHRLLDRAGIDSSVTEILFEGADHGRVETVDDDISFARSLPLSDALHPETLLATAMNGEPLPPRYGAPIRLVVPGWFGMASVKWLRRIDARATPFDGYFQTQRYIYSDGHHSVPVTRMRVKSMIADPPDGATIAAGTTRILGWAWSGDGAITGVEVSRDGERRWHPARLHPAESRTAWTRWEIELDLHGTGPCILRSRARDEAGNVQPDTPPWNTLGYGNNAIRAVTIHIT
jgi:DMSO/TMAO reductase YedYZ molybdopterin-dependent catalytic subunit